MAEENASDELDEFIHSYSSPEYDAGEAHSSDYFDDDASGSDLSSESPEDLAAEAEDMELYDLYDRSARPSPLGPSSPILHEEILERDSVLGTIDEDPKALSQHAEWRKRPYGPQTHKSSTGVSAEDSSESDIDRSEDEELSEE